MGSESDPAVYIHHGVRRRTAAEYATRGDDDVAAGELLCRVGGVEDCRLRVGKHVGEIHGRSQDGRVHVVVAPALYQQDAQARVCGCDSPGDGAAC